MNNDNRDDQDGSPDGDAEQQLGFDSDSFEPSSADDRKDRFFNNFDDETAEIDDIEPGDYGDDFDADDDPLAGDPRDDTVDLWGEDADEDVGESPSGLSAAEELKAMWDDDPEPEPEDTEASLEATPAATDASSTAPEDDTPDFSDWPHDEPDEDPEPPEAPELWDLADDDEEEPPAADATDEWRTAAAAALSTGTAMSSQDNEDSDQDDPWDTDVEEEEPEEDWEDDDWQDDEAPKEGQLPWGMIAVAGIAVLLLGIGGFGVLQERSALQEEVTELRSQLATSASPEEVSEARESLRTMEESQQALEDEIERLQLENRRLTDTVAGLESQLKNQANAVEELERSAEKARAAAARQSASASTAAAGSSGTYFVNFGSYSNRAIAEDWATRLRKDYGKVIVAPATSQGRSMYRVRVIALPSKAEAERVARQLEQAHDLSKLWIGAE